MVETNRELSKLDYSELYSLYATDILRVCYVYLNDRAKAEDVCQEVFVKLITKKPKLIAGSEKSWLLRVAVNRCRDIWRSSWMKRVSLGDDKFNLIPDTDKFAVNEEKQELMNAIYKLPPQFKETIVLHYYQGYNISEIAKMLDLSEGTVASRLSRGRSKLAKILKRRNA